jgi:hypothetical protein
LVFLSSKVSQANRVRNKYRDSNKLRADSSSSSPNTNTNHPNNKALQCQTSSGRSLVEWVTAAALLLPLLKPLV